MIIEQQIRTTTVVLILQLQLFHNQLSKQGLRPEYKYVLYFRIDRKYFLFFIINIATLTHAILDTARLITCG